VIATEIHQPQRVIGVGHRIAELTQTQPAVAAVIVLHELAIGLLALLFGEDEVLAEMDRFADEIVVITLKAVRAFAIGPTFGFELQNAEVDTHLNHLAAVVPFDDADVGRVHLVGKVSQDAVNVFATRRHYSQTRKSRQREYFGKSKQL
jgi:hypothetical protein